jgi:capsular exopolysaccharide synthesis family protein
MTDQLNIQKLLIRGLNYWYLFALILPLSILVAYYYLQTTQPQYQASALLMIRDEKTTGSISEEAIFNELGITSGIKNLENEAMVIRSTSILKEAVRMLGLQYNYTSVNGLQKKTLYKNSPVQVVNWEPAYEYAALKGELFLEPDGKYRLELEEGDEYTGEFGRKLETPFGKLTLSYRGTQQIDGSIELQVVDDESMAWSLIERMEIEILGEKSSTLQLLIRDLSKERAKDILNATMAVYNQRTINDKNRVFQGTIDLINERVYLINKELTQAEQDVESYKRQFNVMELGAEGSLLMKEIATYDKDISETHVQLEILGTIEAFLANDKNFEFVPTNLTLQNLTISQQIAQFNELLAERERMRPSRGLAHPELKLIDRQIQNLRGTIVENIQSIKRDLEITANSFENQKDNLQGRMAKLPRRERELIEIERIKNIKENLFLYLLQKREESTIRQEATVSAGEIIEPAAANPRPVSPKPAQIWLIAIFLGIAFPAGIVIVLDSLNNKVVSQEDVEELTAVPVAGVLSQHKSKEKVVVQKESRTVVAELFRLLRANLSYIMPDKNLKVLLITSSSSGEGKSFISLNLAMTLALSNKRVMILELDLRKPKQKAYLDIKDSEDLPGLVDYLVDPELCFTKIIRNSGLHSNLDFIPSGPKPPNPSELTLSPRLRDLLAKIKAEYDFVILDAPPVGLVADALQMKDLAEATMYVVRSGVTLKPQLKIIQNIAEKEKLPRPFIVLNGVKANGAGNYAYADLNGYLEK